MIMHYLASLYLLEHCIHLVDAHSSWVALEMVLRRPWDDLVVLGRVVGSSHRGSDGDVYPSKPETDLGGGLRGG